MSAFVLKAAAPAKLPQLLKVAQIPGVLKLSSEGLGLPPAYWRHYNVSTTPPRSVHHGSFGVLA